MNVTEQQLRLERALQLEPSPLPQARPIRGWALAAWGLVLGLGVGAGHRWLIAPINPAPQARQCPELRFHLAPLKSASLEPVWPPGLARRWAPGGDLHHHLGPQQPPRVTTTTTVPAPQERSAGC
jgi:hypothetical protein